MDQSNVGWMLGRLEGSLLEHRTNLARTLARMERKIDVLRDETNDLATKVDNIEGRRFGLTVGQWIKLIAASVAVALALIGRPDLAAFMPF